MYDENQKTSGAITTLSPIESALSGLGKEISVLEEALSLLRSRVSGVAKPATPPMPCIKADSQPTGPHSPAWHSITESKDRITSICADIRELTGRIES
jgi:hypothetical protein